MGIATYLPELSYAEVHSHLVVCDAVLLARSANLP